MVASKFLETLICTKNCLLKKKLYVDIRREYLPYLNFSFSRFKGFLRKVFEANC